MSSVSKDFQQRRMEVLLYFRFVIDTCEGRITIPSHTKSKVLQVYAQEELLKTLKASCYLLLYNLVESTLRGLIQQIFDEFKTQNIRYDDCRQEVKKIVVLNFRRRNFDDQLVQKLADLAIDIINESFDPDKLFSGNVDAKTIRETAEEYGFAPPATKATWTLREVKENRNDLAHGSKSFSEVGRDVTPQKLKMAYRQMTRVLSSTIKNVNTYVEKRHYLASTLTPTAPTP